MDETLTTLARDGNVRDLYQLIKTDGNALRRIDEVEFTDTPLHIAADAGCIDFAMEIMSLKPSFARKLNHEGLSPIHLAVEKGNKELVLNLMDNAKDLVRVKGKNGETPLHYVITREVKSEVLLLPRFLEDCPESIRDVTAENQTALHIAVSNNNLKALKILCKKLRKMDYCREVVNQKDRKGDTALHMAARSNQHEMVKLLLKCKADKQATNLAGKTALKVAEERVAEKRENTKSIRILRGSFLPGVPTFNYTLEKKISKHLRNASAVIFQDMDSVSSEDRNALLVILGLLLTSTFQACLSPPGSVWQEDSPPEKQAGKSIMDQSNFLQFYIPTCAVFMVTFFLTLGLLRPFPRHFRTALQLLLAFLAICFHQSIHFLAPSYLAAAVINQFSVLIFFLMTLMCFSYRVSQLSVLILGGWLFSRDDLFRGFMGDTVGGYIIVQNVMVVFWSLLLLFMYDDFWKGTAVGVGYCLFVNITDWFVVPLGVHVLVGCWLFLFLHDNFWKGSVFVVGFCVINSVRYVNCSEPIVVVGCWLSLSLFRFCQKRSKIRCNVVRPRWLGMHR